MRIIYMNLGTKLPGTNFLNGDFVRGDSEYYKRKVFRYAFYPYDQGYAYHEPGFSCEFLILGEIRFDYLRKQWIKTLAYDYENIEEDFFSKYVRAEYVNALTKKRLVTTRLLSKKKGEKVFYESFANWPFEFLYTDSDHKRGTRFESRMNKILPRLIKKYKRLDEMEYKAYCQEIRAVG